LWRSRPSCPLVLKVITAALFLLIHFSFIGFFFKNYDNQTFQDKMAAPNGGFFIQDKLYKKAPHHESYKQLWETKWKKPVSIRAGSLLSNYRTDCTIL